MCSAVLTVVVGLEAGLAPPSYAVDNFLCGIWVRHCWQADRITAASNYLSIAVLFALRLGGYVCVVSQVFFFFPRGSVRATAMHTCCLFFFLRRRRRWLVGCRDLLSWLCMPPRLSHIVMSGVLAVLYAPSVKRVALGGVWVNMFHFIYFFRVRRNIGSSLTSRLQELFVRVGS